MMIMMMTKYEQLDATTIDDDLDLVEEEGEKKQ